MSYPYFTPFLGPVCKHLEMGHFFFFKDVFFVPRYPTRMLWSEAKRCPMDASLVIFLFLVFKRTNPASQSDARKFEGDRRDIFLLFPQFWPLSLHLRTDRRANGRTDTASYREARTQLIIVVWNVKETQSRDLSIHNKLPEIYICENHCRERGSHVIGP